MGGISLSRAIIRNIPAYDHRVIEGFITYMDNHQLLGIDEPNDSNKHLTLLQNIHVFMEMNWKEKIALIEKSKEKYGNVPTYMMVVAKDWEYPEMQTTLTVDRFDKLAKPLYDEVGDDL